MAKTKTTTETNHWLIWSLLQLKHSKKVQHQIAQELLREGVGICLKNDGKSSDDRMAQIERLRGTTYIEQARDGLPLSPQLWRQLSIRP